MLLSSFTPRSVAGRTPVESRPNRTTDRREAGVTVDHLLVDEPFQQAELRRSRRAISPWWWRPLGLRPEVVRWHS